MPLAHDFRQARRAVRNAPGFSAGVVLVLTVGLGLSGAIFALADPFLWRPLPYADPDRLVAISVDRPREDIFTPLDATNIPTLDEWRNRTDLFVDVGAYSRLQQLRLTGLRGTVSLRLREVSPNLLGVLGQPAPALGGAFASVGDRMVLRIPPHRDDEDAPGDAAGDRLRSEDGTVYNVAATLPADFIFPFESLDYRPDLLAPAPLDRIAWNDPGGGWGTLLIVARLQPQVTVSDAAAAIAVSAARAGLRSQVEPLSKYMAGDVRMMALGALGAGLLITLVCAANILGLFIARGVYRAQGFAVRQALGASKQDLLTLVVLELGLLGLAAAAASILAAHLTLIAAGQVIPNQYAALGEPAITGRVVLFVLALTAVIVATCIVPVWIAARAASMGNISRTQVREPERAPWLRLTLITAQTAVAMTLLVSAAFVGRSYANLWLQDTGLDADARVVAVSYPRTQPQPLRMVEASLDALRHVVGVADAAAGAGVGLMLDGYEGGGGPAIHAAGQTLRLLPSQVTPNYFDVAGIPVIAGRGLRTTDTGWSAVVLNEALARRFWPDRPLTRIIGEPITVNGDPGEIVGIVRNTFDRSLDRRPPARIYKRLESLPIGRVSYIVKPSGPLFADAAIRRAVTTIEPAAIVDRIDSIVGRLAESIRDRSFVTLILTLFAASAVGVTAAGIFALVAFITARQTHQLAIRVALGAGASQVLTVVLRAPLIASALGGVIGFGAGLVLVRILESRLYGVEKGDPSTLGAAAIAFVVLTLLASWLPARRALAADPCDALRTE